MGDTEIMWAVKTGDLDVVKAKMQKVKKKKSVSFLPFPSRYPFFRLLGPEANDEVHRRHDSPVANGSLGQLQLWNRNISDAFGHLSTCNLIFAANMNRLMLLFRVLRYIWPGINITSVWFATPPQTVNIMGKRPSCLDLNQSFVGIFHMF